MLTRKQIDDIERVAIDARQHTCLIDDGKFALIATVRELREVLDTIPRGNLSEATRERIQKAQE